MCQIAVDLYAKVGQLAEGKYWFLESTSDVLPTGPDGSFKAGQNEIKKLRGTLNGLRLIY